MSWGGKRPGAGRPLVENKRVKIWPTVAKATLAALSQIAFDKSISLGEAIDTVTNKFTSKKKPKL